MTGVQTCALPISNLLIANDFEDYSRVINECYLSNKSNFDIESYSIYSKIIKETLEKKRKRGIISKNYAPLDDNDIKPGERVFYTRDNAEIIDTIRYTIDKVPDQYKKYFLAPLLYQASVHNNTGGVFKGFYKDSSTGIGKFGGGGEHALKRIKGTIDVLCPIFSNFECNVRVYQRDSNELLRELDKVDLIYIDPPYNQHPYGSNYFMLNLIVNNKINTDLSKISGIPKEWNKSQYNKKTTAITAFEDLISSAKAEYLIISYNSEGFISYDEMTKTLKKYGELRVHEILYNTYRASRNLYSRDKYVKEYLFILKK